MADTQCGAPTSVKGSGYVTLTSRSFTVSWSGATGNIRRYKIFYRISQDGIALPTKTEFTGYALQSDPTLNTKTITIPDEITLNRGYIIRLGVVAQGQTGALDSNITNGGGLIINSLPTRPTIIYNKNLIPSTGSGEITFTGTPGTDEDSRQNVRIRYAIGSTTATRKSFTSPMTLTFNEPTTVYFWSYDGYEYSEESVSVSITRNIKPAINSITVSASNIKSYTFGGSGGNTDYDRKGYAYGVVPELETNKNTNSVIVTALIAETAMSIVRRTEIEETFQEYTYLSQSFSSSSFTTSLINIYKAITNIDNFKNNYKTTDKQYAWYLKVIVNDGIEDSDPIYWPSETTDFYSVVRAIQSTDLNIYNQFANSNISGTIDKQIWKNIRVRFNENTSLTKVTVASNTTEAIVSSVITEVDETTNKRIVDITLNDGIASLTSIDLTIKISNNDTNETYCNEFAVAVTETRHPSSFTFLRTKTTTKPFTETGDITFKIDWPFGSYTDLSTALSDYNCGDNFATYIQSENLAIEESVDIPFSSLTWTKQGDYLQTNMSIANMYSFNNTLGVTKYTGKWKYYDTVTITNLFGKRYSSTKWANSYLNFNESAIVSPISKVEWALDSDPNNWHDFYVGENGNQVQQGTILRFSCPMSLYTEEGIDLLLRKDNNIVATKSFDTSSLSTATGRTAESNTLTITYEVGEIKNSDNVTWTYTIKNNDGISTPDTITTKKVKQVNPNVTFNKCLRNGSNLDYDFSMEDSSPGGTVVHCIYVGDSAITSAFTDSSGSVAFDPSFSWEVENMYIKTSSTISSNNDPAMGPCYTITRNYISNDILVFKDLIPTVAYRKNQIGINTSAVDASALVDIHQITGKDLILFSGQVTENNTTYDMLYKMDVTQGKIIFTKSNSGTVNTSGYIDFINGILG